MGVNHGQDFLWTEIVPVEEILRGSEQGLHALKELTMGNFATEMPPEHFNRIEPGAVGGQVQQHQSPLSGLNDRIDIFILMGIGVVPDHINGSGWVLFDQGFQQLRDLLPPFPTLELNHRFARIIANAIMSGSLARRADHYLLSRPTPQGASGGEQTHIELTGVIEDTSLFEPISGLFDYLLFAGIVGVWATHGVLGLAKNDFPLGQKATHGFR